MKHRAKISVDVSSIDMPELFALIGELGSNAWSVRAKAALALGEVSFDNVDAIHLAGDYLIRAMVDTHHQVRLAAATSLGALKDQRALPILIVALLNDVPCVRYEAANALGASNDLMALIALRRARHDPDPQVREAVSIAMQRIGARILKHETRDTLPQ